MSWFENWFDNKYYDILYQKRNNEEAKKFIDLLIKFLNLKSGLQVLDLACGKGRHSKKLNNLGFKVTGIDLSKKNINSIKKFENQNLKFIIGDMRMIDYSNKFDVIFNLFTSFGYFDSYEENFLVFDRIKEGLKTNGLFIFDYLNKNYVINHFISYEEKLIKNIKFKIYKSIINNKIIKTIKIDDNSKELVFYEKVHLFSFLKLQIEFKKRNLIIQNVFGSYKLQDYDIKKSERMIIIVKKIEQ